MENVSKERKPCVWLWIKVLCSVQYQWVRSLLDAASENTHGTIAVSIGEKPTIA